mmetsp:Transcript_27342/g.53297  ORF Transcript_27342/g.53297 Transcript_27342/m.53297 type:complete len:803 (+) Transcript_27342:127-2535(+)|eukprot:CAMPEP_0173417586 /NCGR_PEP_ID=MMETSP1356-20130122/85966_1 /TAXON_ID=77927 ORGANISM="Hemiselmis virescens, Strain PCC157" /NCGR_SAMPLE_ID=MMETSP1356 /ASSEMBLY_ACC=CAM_ASM_000847 /LENGTH=802 /DNA_ID=CAMNT_0014379915 /DNA_START=38 /DNA_END=2446 /DNA_ORIENTATION=-
MVEEGKDKAAAPSTPGAKDAGGDKKSHGGHEVATAAFEKMSKRQQLALLAAAGLKAGPNVSLAYAIDKFRRDKIREVFLYAFFLALFTISALLQRDVTDAHYYTQTVKDVILGEDFPGVTWRKTFHDVSVDGDFWDYMTTVIPDYLYTEEWYNGDRFEQSEMNYILHVNRVVQAPRLRQLRVVESDCIVPQRLRKSLNRCYPQFSSKLEDKSPIAGWPPGAILEYKTDEQLETKAYTNGLLPYGGGGFAIDLPLYFNKTEVLEFFTYLKSERWTDLHTRAVFFDFALYNPVNGLFLSVRLLFEFLPYGQVRPSSQFRAIRMGLINFDDYVALLLDLCVYGMVLFYMIMDVRKLLAMGRSYWGQFWHWFNWVNYGVFIITLVYKIQFWLPSLAYINASGDLDIQRASLDFEALGWTYYMVVNWNAFNNIFVWLKAFSFLKYANKGVANLSYTIANAGIDCALFLLIFAIVIFAYAQAFHISFGTDIAEYKTLLDSIFGLFKTLLGSFDFEAIKQVNSILGPLLFVTFEVVCYFVLLNMFLAILNKAYSDVLDKGVDDPMAVEFRNTIDGYFKSFRKKLMFWRNKEVARFKTDGPTDGTATTDMAQDPRRHQLDGEAMALMLQTVKDLSHTLRALNDKVENISKAQALTGAANKLNGGTGSMRKSGGFDSGVMDRPGSDTGAPLAVEPQNTQAPISNNNPPPPPVPGSAAGNIRASSKLPSYTPPTVPNGNGSMSRNPMQGAGVTTTGKPVLPPGWQEATNEEGEVYYFNARTGVTQWEPPSIVVPPPPQRPGTNDEGDLTPRM